MKTIIPFRFFDEMEREMGNLFRETRERGREYLPPMDVYDKEEFYLLTIDLPGMSKKDVDIKIHDGQLMISGERKNEISENSYIERSYGEFKRAFTLPKGVNLEGIEANFENGVLSIAVPKGVEEKVKNIEIKDAKGPIFKKMLNSVSKEQKKEESVSV